MAGAIISSFIAYAVEKRVSRHPEKFGTGAIEGVAAPESANNAATGGAFIPLLTLGIPANAVMAILLGALVIYGMQPGPMLIKEHPEPLLGGRGQHVRRECHAPGPESSPDRALGEGSEDSLSHSLSL